MSELQLGKGERLLFKAIVGSQSYGTSTPTSDIDYKGVYIQDTDDILGCNYRQQIDVTKDEVYFEVKRFLELLQTANPTVLELLYTPDDCIIETSPEFELIRAHRDQFLTKQCKNSFSGYAVAQIKKANGLDKKMNWEKDRVVRKDLLDFVFVLNGEKSIPWKTWAERRGFETKFCGIVNVPHARDVYAAFYDYGAHKCFSETLTLEEREKNKEEQRESGHMGLGFKGLVKEGGSENAGISNQLRLSSVPVGVEPICNIFYNKDGYTQHCKDYREYQEWLENRNTDRYVEVKGHDQKIDGKNMLHCRRLIDTAIEIARDGILSVRRPNAEYLLSIRRGEVDLKTLLADSEAQIKDLDRIYAESTIPEKVEDRELVHNLLVRIRRMGMKETSKPKVKNFIARLWK